MIQNRNNRYLVTGAQGNVGSAVVNALLARGASVRALLRPGSNASSVLTRCEIFQGDLNQVEDVTAAAQGMDGVFLLAGYEGIDQALVAMADIGVRRAVLMSTVAAASGDLTNAISAFHIRSEHAVATSGLEWTSVRSYALMSNIFRWTDQLASSKCIRLPFADVPIAMVDPADLAEIISICLLESGHNGKTYPVSGPRALLPAEQIELVAQALGREVTFEPIPGPAARREMAATMPAPYVDAFFRYYEHGEIDETTVVDTVHRLTGRAPATLADYLQRPSIAQRLAPLNVNAGTQSQP